MMISTGGRDGLATVTLKINSFDFDAIDFQSSNVQCEFFQLTLKVQGFLIWIKKCLHGSRPQALTVRVNFYNCC